MENNIAKLVKTIDVNSLDKGADALFKQAFYPLRTSLGHVLRTVSDDKTFETDALGKISEYWAKTIPTKDYYPFDMIMIGCNGNSGNYRYSFNGMESDNEIKGVGNSLDFVARIYDARIGRFLSLDPRMTDFPFMTPYCFAANNPIYNVDFKGENPVPFHVYKKGILDNMPKLSDDEILKWQATYYSKKLEAEKIGRLSGNYKDELSVKWNLMMDVANKANSYGFSLASSNLEHYLMGSGNKKIIDYEDIIKYQYTLVDLEYNINRFFNNDAQSYKYLNVGDAASNLIDGQAIYYDDYYETTVYTSGRASLMGENNPSSDYEGMNTDLFYGLGNFTLTSKANFTITRKGEKYFIQGSILNNFSDVYDWEAMGLSVDIFGVTIYDSELEELKTVGAKTFNIESTTYEIKFQSGSYFFMGEDGEWDYSNVKLNY